MTQLSSRVLVLLLPVLLAVPAPGRGVGAGEKKWRAAHDRLRERCDELASNLNRGRELLLERAAGNDELLERLESASLELREAGYGVLPKIKQDAPLSPVEPQQQLYSMESLTTDLASEFRDAAGLVRHAADREMELDGLVAEHERIRDRLRNLETHLGYHRYWQRAVLENPLAFAARNKIIVRLRALESELRGGADAAAIAAERGALVERLAPFRPTRGLELAERDDGWRVLPVSVTTDIDDERFLAAFRQAVEAAFVDAAEPRALRFRIELTFRRISPAELYPGGPPAPGDLIDPQAHRARFPKHSLILTTGAASTHAWTGRWVTLGPEDLSRRTMAHEFAHLLGFDDAYLRGFDGELDDPFGVVLVEWTGLRDDLMGNVRGGRVTRGMIETLIEAYGSR